MAIFNLDGKQIFGYNSSTVNDKLIDCYCVANFGRNKIVFNGYGNFDLQEIDLKTMKINVHKTPEKCIGANAISTKNSKVIFHSIYQEKNSFFIWDIHTNSVEKVESNFKNLHGTENGYFYKYSKKDFTLISPI